MIHQATGLDACRGFRQTLDCPAEIKHRNSVVTEYKPKPNAESLDPLYSPQHYEPPKLTSLGDVRDLTLGGSAGTGDSGNPGLQQF
jgi:hypothetical protein